MDVGFKTDKGVKRTNNEDAFFIMKKDKVFIVADGVGGTNSGEIASRTAVNEIAQCVEERGTPEGLGDTRMDTETFFLDAIRGANQKVYEMSQRYEANKGMATTLVIAYVKDKDLLVCNLGDSRAYLYREGVLRQITSDHTYVNELVKAGVISEDQARFHVDKNMMTKGIGADKNVDPDFFHVRLHAGDRLLLCTDGLYGEVGDTRIARIFAAGENMTDTCNKLVDVANISGGSDNITGICIEFTEEDFHE